MVALLAAALEAISEGLKLANTESSRKYVEELKQLRLSILAEEERGYNSDDAKLESLYKRLPVLIEAARGELALLRERSSS